jgi:hypothetical protein
LQTTEGRAGSNGTRRVIAASAAAVAVVSILLLLLLLLLLVFLVVLHVRRKGRRCVVTPVAYCTLEWLLVVVRFHVNLQVVTAINKQFENLEALRKCSTPFCSL